VPAELRDHHGPALPVFPTGTGGHHSDSNVRNRLLAGAVTRVNEKRAAEGEMLLPEKVTPHTLRRTFASLALAAGRDPRWVMAQLGHTDARFTLTVYAQVMQRQRVDKELIWRLMRFPDEPESESFGPGLGQRGPKSTRSTIKNGVGGDLRPAQMSVVERKTVGKRLKGFEPSTFCMASRTRGDADCPETPAKWAFLLL
jgi:Phage integrase family